MTSIAVRDGVMVSDGRVTLGDTVIKDDMVKVFWVNNHLVGGAGRARSISTFVHWLQKQTDFNIVSSEVGDLVDLVPPVLDDDDGFSALVLTPTKQVLLYDGNIPIDLGNDVYTSIGSGSVYCLAAMDAGASAEEAVKVAMKRDVFSGGTITTVQLEEEPEMIDKEKALSMSHEELVSYFFPEEYGDVSVEEQEIVVNAEPEDELLYIKKWDIDETILLYKVKEGYGFEVEGVEFNANYKLEVEDMKLYAGFEKQELISICAKMGLDLKSKDTYEKLTDKISKEVQRVIKDYEQSNM